MSTGAPATLPVIGRCVECKRPYRVDVLASEAAKWANVVHAMRASGVPAVWCGCRAGVRCAENRYGLPQCGLSDCDGHPQTFVKFSSRPVKVTYKPEMTCGGSCWTAKGSGCTCSCRGANHGGAWSIT